MYRQLLLCKKKSKQRTGKFKTIMLKVNAKTIMKKNEYVTNHGFNPKPAGSVDKATN
jgi:hypothetical protein